MEKITFESVEEFLARGGKITTVKPAKAYGSQKPQMIKVKNSFSHGRKAFTVGGGANRINQKRTVEMESK